MIFVYLFFDLVKVDIAAKPYRSPSCITLAVSELYQQFATGYHRRAAYVQYISVFYHYFLVAAIKIVTDENVIFFVVGKHGRVAHLVVSDRSRKHYRAQGKYDGGKNDEDRQKRRDYDRVVVFGDEEEKERRAKGLSGKNKRHYRKNAHQLRLSADTYDDRNAYPRKVSSYAILSQIATNIKRNCRVFQYMFRCVTFVRADKRYAPTGAIHVLTKHDELASP